MTQIGLHKVEIIESEAGWGQKVDEVLYFATEAEARNYARNYNLRWNTADTVPDLYMAAHYVGTVK